jgi:hypothetical protein
LVWNSGVFYSDHIKLEKIDQIANNLWFEDTGGPGVITLGKVSIGDENKWKVGDNCVEIKEKEDFT